jgi:hypothetical protein
MSSFNKEINSILESLGPEVTSPNITPITGEKLYKLLDDITGEHEIFDEDKYEKLKKANPEAAKKVIEFTPTSEEMKHLKKNVKASAIKSSSSSKSLTPVNIGEDPHYRYLKEKDDTFQFITEARYNRLKEKRPEEVAKAYKFDPKESVREVDINEKEKEKEREISETKMTPVKGLKDAIPEDIFGEDVEDMPEEPQNPEKVKGKQSITPQQMFDNLVDAYFKSNPYIKAGYKSPELEVRFGTRKVKHLTKNDYDDVIKKLKSDGFTCQDENGISRLTVKNVFLDKNTGTFRTSNIRTEIYGITQIQKYCKTNDINELLKFGFEGISFVKKDYEKDENNKKYLVNFDDFNFRVSYQFEESYMSKTGKNSYGFIIQNWKNSKKEFRYLNRVTFTHPDHPINVDISISKSSDFGQKYYTLEESNIFEKQEVYEIELEVDNKKIGPGTLFNNYKSILDSLRKVIKIVLSGLQGTNYPVSYVEQKSVINSYMNIIYKDAYKPDKPVRNNNFIGPNSFTLQMTNVAKIDENFIAPNIRKDFVVTDKADGDRHLMFIHESGKIYLIDTNMKVIFTGSQTFNKELYNTIIDGELILHDKNKKFFNTYAAFDIYYLNKLDVRATPFIKLKDEGDQYKSRYMLLKKTITKLDAVSILKADDSSSSTKTATMLLEKYKKSAIYASPIKFLHKRFLPENPDKGDIFSACNEILSQERQGLFKYNTDGLIFTHAYFGVGSDSIDKAGPLSKITWAYSFKWKPPQYNTIDFLVDTIKTPSGEDVIRQKFETGTNILLNEQSNNYKIIQLKCTFVESEHGFINPCQDIIDDNLPEYKNYEERNNKESKPVQFYPTNPYDVDAGLCKILLRKDDNNSYQMFTTEEDIFYDNTIVEFSYDQTKEKGWRWNPLRVRHDKTADMRQNKRNFGNAYHVANSNWQSIHNPITEDMICTGLNIPDVMVDEDIYYNKSVGGLKTEGLKDFHNLFVKKTLITSVSNPGDTLIDYACGKAGDLPKWIASKLSFVFGVDKSKDNLENRLDGACARFLKLRKTTKHMPHALFVHGDSGFNIKNGSGLLNDKAIQITKTVFGTGSSDPDKIGKGVARQFGKAKDGFNVSSCQFALHYFFENAETLQGFMRNVSECTKLGGYFIGTAYDGKQIFKLLSKKQKGESIQIVEDGKKIWEVVKNYSAESFDDNSSSIGYTIDVYQESINQLISEYIINFDYLDRVLENYGFKLISRDEAKSFGLPEASGLFSELYMKMLEEIKINKFKEKDYGKSIEMTAYEKKISFLNRYFVYKKVMMVNTEKVELELGEYNEMDRVENNFETREAVKVATKQVQKSKPLVKKLNKKLLLVNATEALDDEPQTIQSVIQNEKENEKKKEKKTKPKKIDTLVVEQKKPSKSSKKKIVIEDDEDSS